MIYEVILGDGSRMRYRPESAGLTCYEIEKAQGSECACSVCSATRRVLVQAMNELAGVEPSGRC